MKNPMKPLSAEAERGQRPFCLGLIMAREVYNGGFKK